MTKSRGINAPRARWTPALDAQLRSLYPDNKTEIVAEIMGARPSQVYNRAHALGLKKSPDFKASESSGRIQRGKQHPAMKATQFKTGITPWNKGLEFHAGGRCAETQFAKGHKPRNWQPLGSLRITADGYLERKVTNLPGPNNVRWHPVHRLVWAAAHGPIPPGHLVVFKPGQKTQVLELITEDRLECITRAQHAQRNHPRSHSPELACLVQLKGAITRQVNRIQRQSQPESQPA